MSKFDISDYKQKIIHDIINTPDIVAVIDSKSSSYDPESPDSLIYTNIFPYMRVPDVQTETQTYITMSVDVVNINKANPTYHDIRMTLRILAHQDNQKMPSEKGTRLDYIANELRRLFDGSQKYGFYELRLTSDKEFILTEHYQYRDLTFRTYDVQHSLCGS